MSLRIVAALFFAASVPVCAAVAFVSVFAADRALGETVPSSCGKRGLIVGLMGIWGTVLFGYLMGQADRVATWLAPPPVQQTGSCANGPRSR